MKRRDTLKALSLTGFGLAVTPVEAAVPEPQPKPLKIPGGRQKFEAERDAKLMAEKFFTPHELQTVTVLSDIIIPADAKVGECLPVGGSGFHRIYDERSAQQPNPHAGWYPLAG